MAEGVDYAWDRPSVAGLVSAGKKFVVRYGGPGSDGKQIQAAELAALTAAGIAVVANAEGTANGFRGRTAGIAWAKDAEAHFRGLGMPGDRPIYFSADWDVASADYDEVDAALRGAAEVIGAARVGLYGGYNIIRHAQAAGTARWFWQTYAWSGGRWASGTHLQQYRNGVSLAGGTVDLNRSMVADYGQWGQQEDDMPLTDAEIQKIAAAAASAVHGQKIGARTYTFGQVAEKTWNYSTTYGQILAAVTGLGEVIARESANPDEVRAALAAMPQPTVDADALAAALAPKLVASLPADSPITDEQLARVLRTVLGSLNDAPQA